MKADDQYMDDQFRKVAGEMKFPYRPEFWNEVESQLADDSMDAAFQKAATHVVALPSVSFSDDIADAYLDDAFSSASVAFSTEYNPEFFKEFKDQEAILEQDVAFLAAANSITADYHSAYWTDADAALQSEGLHYEYHSSYWDEAKQLLDRADRRMFFVRWSAVAGLLLLLSFGGLFQTGNKTVIGNQNYLAVGKISANNGTQLAGEHEKNNSSIAISDNVTVFENNNSGTNSNSNSSDHENIVIQRSTDSEQKIIPDPNEIDPNNVAVVVNDPSTLEDPNGGVLTNTPPTTETGAENNGSIQQDPLAAEMNANLSFNFAKNKPAARIESERADAPVIEIQKFEKPASHEFSFIANGGVGNKYSKIDFVPSLRTSIGFEYMHIGYGRLRDLKFGASVSMNHARQSDFGTERRVSVYNTDGGVDKFWYKLQLKDMIYTNVSGIASYELSPKQNLRLSFGIDYLMFVQSNMSYQVESDKNITTVNNNWGVKDGLSKFDLRMGFGYEYQFSNRFAGQINGNLGFFDRTDDQFIDKSFFDQEMSVTVGVKYTFLRKS